MLYSKLQWGHRLSTMVTRRALHMMTKATLLQWGHRLSAMVTCKS